MDLDHAERMLNARYTMQRTADELGVRPQPRSRLHSERRSGNQQPGNLVQPNQAAATSSNTSLLLLKKL